MNSTNSLFECSHCGKYSALSPRQSLISQGSSSSPLIKTKSLSKNFSTSNSSSGSSSNIPPTSSSSTTNFKPPRSHNKLSTQSNKSNNNNNNNNSNNNRNNQSICPYCSSNPSRPSTSTSSLNSPSFSSQKSPATSMGSLLYQEPASRPGTSSGTGISRTRSKIQAARDEKHFLEDNIFII